jgi:HEAT repeat protein
MKAAALAVALLATVLAAAPAAAQPSRERALADLGRVDDVGARRAAVQALAEEGQMADLPVLARALRDSDPIVRRFTESAMWQVWSRSGEETVDRLFATGVEQDASPSSRRPGTSGPRCTSCSATIRSR